MAVATLLAGCAAQPTPAAGPTSSPSIPPTAAGTRDCGTLTLRQGQELPPDALQCVIEATETRQPAQLVVTLPTIEGDPITTSYSVTADGQVEVTTDARADRLGSGNVERQTCTGPTIQDGLRLSFATCSSPEVG
ncbi:hypothetical protein SAMN05443287_101557 [Micromonospora phaseoli]|uniref:Uncharacterized protein n=1 Tax=Micromonospora phaseoli TaxID=1144548 RepID=A0A1H6SGY6_9ACTN|nr:hypothetical protein [Micromonospora phaseoli]PZW03806.1 hypothetical protein CLV64_101557 [Micromonospora phaseoli]GIJ79108.1 hypothetical protein Xph01_35400 [Micromonospora phaseoli]SEI63025.1 hypothetical protein SAMN05443287_101557 [Micromonospora phaseoli]